CLERCSVVRNRGLPETADVSRAEPFGQSDIELDGSLGHADRVGGDRTKRNLFALVLFPVARRPAIATMPRSGQRSFPRLFPDVKGGRALDGTRGRQRQRLLDL